MLETKKFLEQSLKERIQEIDNYIKSKEHTIKLAKELKEDLQQDLEIIKIKGDKYD